MVNDATFVETGMIHDAETLRVIVSRERHCEAEIVVRVHAIIMRASGRIVNAEIKKWLMRHGVAWAAVNVNYTR